MKKLLYVPLVLLMACNSSQKTVSEPTAAKIVVVDPAVYAETITEAQLKTHLYIYASDEYEGRETGQPGQKKAIAYLKGHYEKLGISAAKSDGDYFQKVPLEIEKLPAGNITLNGKSFEQGKDFVSYELSVDSFSEVVYVGYGIEDDKYSDYTDVDVTDKIVLIKEGEPKNEDGTYVISGSIEPSKWSADPMKRISIPLKKGAKGVLLYSPTMFPRVVSQYMRTIGSDSEKMSIKIDRPSNFSAIISAEMAKSIIPNIDLATTLENKSIEMKTALVTNSVAIDSENVAAIIKGSEKPNEYVVISSHLDHIGVNADGEINNGADDDGSGTVALLEIAKAFKSAADAGNGSKRSIIFLHVTGEEKGLLGSQYYTDVDPIVPLENTVANLNIDMIGRIDPKREGERNYIYLIGSDKLSTDLHKLSEEVNTKYSNIELDYTYNDENDPNRFYYRSDHYNFAKNNIPIIFYFNGTHEDYHRPGDTPDKINYDLLQNRSRLVFHTAWEVANREQRVIVDKASK